MLEWIDKKVRGARMALAFLKYEGERRREHREIAKVRFSTAELEREIEELATSAERDASSRFDARLAELRARIDAVNSEIAERKRQRDLFCRPYQSEIDQLYRQIADLKVDIDALYEEKDEAYVQIKAAQAQIDHWYRMSNSSFGQKGKDIPNFNLFGRSQYDLEYFKTIRASAHKTARECRELIASRKSELNDAYESIGALKAERREMLKLKRVGVTAELLTKQIADLESERDRFGSEAAQVEGYRSKFLAEARRTLGIIDREAAIKRLNWEREVFLAWFDTEAAKAERRAAHERRWRVRHPKRKRTDPAGTVDERTSAEESPVAGGGLRRYRRRKVER